MVSYKSIEKHMKILVSSMFSNCFFDMILGLFVFDGIYSLNLFFIGLLFLFRCCRCSRRPLPLGDVFSSTRRCANCRRDQKGRIQTIYLLYTPKIDSSGRQNGAHIAKKWVENHCKIDSGDSKCSFGE